MAAKTFLALLSVIVRDICCSFSRRFQKYPKEQERSQRQKSLASAPFARSGPDSIKAFGFDGRIVPGSFCPVKSSKKEAPDMVFKSFFSGKAESAILTFPCVLRFSEQSQYTQITRKTTCFISKFSAITIALCLFLLDQNLQWP